MTPIQRKFVKKPWGAEDWLVNNDHYTLKQLYLNPGEEISLQYHNEKHETMIVLYGMGEVHMGSAGDLESPVGIGMVTVGDTIVIPPQTIHQIKAYTAMTILEVSTPHTDDLVRVGRDKYGRK